MERFTHQILLIGLIVCLLLIVSCKEETIEKTEELPFIIQPAPFHPQVIGDGRNDGLNRVYTSAFEEVTYQNGWAQTAKLLNSAKVPGHRLVLAQVKEAGKNCVYSLTAYRPTGEETEYKSFLIEHDWDGSRWQRDTVQSSYQSELFYMAEGNFRSTGKESLIVFEWEAEVAYRYWEYYFEDGKYEKELIAEFEQNSDDLLVDMKSGDLRHEGKESLYFTNRRGYLHELRFTGSWTDTEIDQVVPTEPNLYYAYAFKLGPLSTGDRSLFVSGFENFHIYRYKSDSWEKESFDAEAGGHMMVVGDLRNDGVYRVYLPALFERLYEITWQGEITAYDIPGTAHLHTAIIADGRNDGVNRMYLSHQDGISELTYSD